MAQTKPTGRIGTKIYKNEIQWDDINSKLTGSSGIQYWKQMLLTDAQVNATRLSIELPIRGAQWDVFTPDTSRKGAKVQEFVRSQLMDSNYFNWEDFLIETLNFLWYGFEVQEKIYIVDGEYYSIKKLSPRLQETIYKWITNNDGTLKGVQQQVYVNGILETPLIDNSKLLIYSNQKRGLDYWGKSIFRPAWKSWYIKDQLIRFDAIKQERFSVGFPKITRNPDAATLDTQTQDDKDTAQEIGETLFADEKQYLYLPPGWELEFMDMKVPNTSNIMESIKYHNQEISQNILASFLDYGKTETGSRAQATSSQRFFLNSLEATSRYISRTLFMGDDNRNLIKELVDLNFNGVTQYPYIVATGFADIDLKDVSEVLRNLSLVDDLDKYEIEEYIKDKFGLQLKPEQTTPEPPEEPDEEEEQTIEQTDKRYKLAEAYRDFTKLEKSINLQEIENKVIEFENEAITLGKKARRNFVNFMTERGIEIISQAKTPSEVDKLVNKTNIPNVSIFEKDMLQTLTDLGKYSRQKVRKEIKTGIKAQDTVEDDAETRKAVKAEASMAIIAIIDILKPVWKKELTEQVINGEVSTIAIRESLESLSQAKTENMMRQKVRRVFGLERNSEAYNLKDKVVKITRSEVWDSNICSECKSIDGAEFSFEDDLFHDTGTGGYTRCEGGQDACRGINIYETD